MTKNVVYSLFEEMIQEAKKILLSTTVNSLLTINKKADKSLVTECDKAINKALVAFAEHRGYNIISEEGEQNTSVVKSGNYMTIDPIDGTSHYIESVNLTIEKDSIQNFLKTDFGPEHDFCLLLGIVENGLPRWAGVYHYVTQEKIFIDGESANNLIRTNVKRHYSQQSAVYITKKHLTNPLIVEALSKPNASKILQSAFGLKSTYALLNSHTNALAFHQGNAAGIWDVLPAAVAARVFGGELFADTGEELQYNSYVTIPGTGVAVIKGTLFNFFKENLHPLS